MMDYLTWATLSNVLLLGIAAGVWATCAAIVDLLDEVRRRR